MSQLKVDSVVDSSGGNTVTINGATPTQYNTMGRNRIINGDMRIDQRNAGASVSVTNTNPYTIDRWQAIGQGSDGVYSVQQDSSAPVGFNYSAKITITTADASIGATQQYLFRQLIEGYNVADLNWGTANAKTVTLSFWVRSSVTGTFGASIRNAAVNRAYPFTYSISDADTWEQKTVTIAGDTTGTWEKTTLTGLEVVFSLGSGADRLDTAGSWVAANRTGVTGQTNLIATNGATWYITGVQLEVGSVATEFERRPYGMELALCQRYYQLISGFNGVGNAGGTTISGGITFPVTMRASPSIGTTNALNITLAGVADYTQSSANIGIVVNRVSTGGVQYAAANFSGITQHYPYADNLGGRYITLSSEL